MLLPSITVLDLSHNLLTEVQYLEVRIKFAFKNFSWVDYITFLYYPRNFYLLKVLYIWFIMQELTFLTELNLSYNEIRHLADFPFRIPSVSKLNLAGNGIQNIQGIFNTRFIFYHGWYYFKSLGLQALPIKKFCIHIDLNFEYHIYPNRLSQEILLVFSYFLMKSKVWNSQIWVNQILVEYFCLSRKYG